MTNSTPAITAGHAAAENVCGSGTNAQPSLVRKLAEVMASIDHVPKRGKNTFHNYEYALEADIVAALRMELAKRHVMLIPSTDSYEIRELPAKKDGSARGSMILLRMVMTFHDGESGETLTMPWIGAGEDSGDKSVYKAMTGAIKYALLKTFLIPTGDDPEQDKQERTDRKGKRDATPAQASKPTSVPTGVNPETGEVVSR